MAGRRWSVGRSSRLDVAQPALLHLTGGPAPSDGLYRSCNAEHQEDARRGGYSSAHSMAGFDTAQTERGTWNPCHEVMHPAEALELQDGPTSVNPTQLAVCASLTPLQLMDMAVLTDIGALTACTLLFRLCALGSVC